MSLIRIECRMKSGGTVCFYEAMDGSFSCFTLPIFSLIANIPDLGEVQGWIRVNKNRIQLQQVTTKNELDE